MLIKFATAIIAIIWLAYPQALAQTAKTVTQSNSEAVKKDVKEGRDIPGQIPMMASISGSSSSKVDPPEASDTMFVLNSQEDLDTGCTFNGQRPGGRLRIVLPISRVISKTQNQLTEAQVQQFSQNGIIASKATLSVQPYDVDAVGGEVDEVYFNGVKVGEFSGLNNRWIPNDFQVPMHLIKFAIYNGGGTPTPVNNVIEIKIDVTGENQWCTAVDWVALKVQTMSPVVLIHGNASDGEFFTRQGFKTRLDELGVLTDNSIFLEPKYIATNARRINQQIPSIVSSFGVDSIHVVTHSKGGLDFRGYLESWHQVQTASAGGVKFRVLSFNTLATPHNGSSLADLLVHGSDYLMSGDSVLSAVLTYFGPYQESHKDLITTTVSRFNQTNIPKLAVAYLGDPKNRITFNTVAADADKNNNNDLDALLPNELKELVDEACRPNQTYGCRLANTLGAKAIYKILRATKAVHVHRSTSSGRPILLYIANNPHEDNDALVGLSSAKGIGSFQALANDSETFTGDPGGRNHASVADVQAATRVLQWLLSADRGEGGDLR